MATHSSDLKFFEGFTSAETNEVLRRMVPVNYGSGETIFSEGEISSALMLITRGQVKVVKKIEGMEGKLLAVLESGDVFGEITFLEEEIPHIASVIAHSAVNVLVLSKNDFEQIARKSPTVTIKLLRRIVHVCGDRIRTLNDEIKNLAQWCISLRNTDRN